MNYPLGRKQFKGKWYIPFVLRINDYDIDGKRPRSFTAVYNEDIVNLREGKNDFMIVFAPEDMVT